MPRVAYWCTSFAAEMEALASQTALLRRMFPGSVLWGVSARDRGYFSWRRGFGVHPRWQLGFRAVTALAQRAFDLNHLMGGCGDWYHLRAIARGPTILTVALDSDFVEPSLLDRVDRFVVEWPAARARLETHGIAPDRIEEIAPPVDVTRFQPQPEPAGPFTVLFASSPDRGDALEARGIGLLLDAAGQRPQYRFRLVWRPWGDGLATLRSELERRDLENVAVEVGCVGAMEHEYAAAHVTAAPFTDTRHCKPAPNSVLESMASGRPVVVTRDVGIADGIEARGAGLVCEKSGASLAAALDQLREEWTNFSPRARAAAERDFSSERFLASYRRLYAGLV